MPYREDGLAGTTTDVGTGTLTLSATAKARHHLPSLAGLGPRPYAIVHDGTPNEAERGFAPYNTSTRQLLRNDASARVTRSTNNNLKVSFSAGTKSVYFGLAAEEARLLLTPTGVKTSAYTAFSGDLVRTDSSGGGFDVTMPASPADGDIVALMDVAASDGWGTNAVTLLRNGKQIAGGVDDILIDEEVGLLKFVFDSSLDSWEPIYTSAYALPAASPAALVVPVPLTASGDFTVAHAGPDRVAVSDESDPVAMILQTFATAGIPRYSVINLARRGTGALTVAAAGGVTLNLEPGFSAALRAQHTTAVLHHDPLDTWTFSGALLET